MNKRNQKGITLVALVITIIVLLILAGVSISLVIGDNGIITRSTQAKADSVTSQETEQISLAYSSALTKNLGDAVTSSGLQTELDVSVGPNLTVVTSNGNSNLDVWFKETNHNYNVNKGKITRLEDGENVSSGLTDLEKLRQFFGKGINVVGEIDELNDNIEPIPDASTSIIYLTYIDIDASSRELIFVYNNNIYSVIITSEYEEVVKKDYSSEFTTIAIQGESIGNYIGPTTIDGIEFVYENSRHILNFETGKITRHYFMYNIANSYFRVYLCDLNDQIISILPEYNPKLWIDDQEKTVVLEQDGNGYNYMRINHADAGIVYKMVLTYEGENVEFEGVFGG